MIGARVSLYTGAHINIIIQARQYIIMTGRANNNNIVARQYIDVRVNNYGRACTYIYTNIRYDLEV